MTENLEKAHYPSKKFHVSIQSKLTATTDEGLVRILLQNIFSNALKYSSKIETPNIEFGKVRKSNKEYFYVRDNGVGFQIQYKDKIFQPFQRLHVDSEFEGVGVGLATVDRIIKKLQGDVIVESTPGRSTTFYFHFGEKS